MSGHKLALFSLYGAFATIALNGVAAKSIGLDALSITQLRCVIGAVVMLITLAVWQGKIGLAERTNYPKALVLGCVMAIHWVTFFNGMMVSTIAIGILAHYTFPIITVLVEPILSRQKPALTDIGVAFAVLIGAATMVPDWHFDSGYTLGLAYGLISAVMFSLRNIFQRHWLQRESSTQVMLIQICVVAVVLSPWVDYSTALNLNPQEWVYLLFLGIISTAAGHTLIAFGLRHVSAKSTGMIGCLQPPLAIFFAWLILAETPQMTTLIGGGIILAAALYESIKQHQKE